MRDLRRCRLTKPSRGSPRPRRIGGYGPLLRKAPGRGTEAENSTEEVYGSPGASEHIADDCETVYVKAHGLDPRAVIVASLFVWVHGTLAMDMSLARRLVR